MYPRFFTLLTGKHGKAMQLAYDLGKLNNGSFKERCDSAASKGSHREMREAVRAALETSGLPSAEAQAIAGAVDFAQIVNYA